MVGVQLFLYNESLTHSITIHWQKKIIRYIQSGRGMISISVNCYKGYERSVARAVVIFIANNGERPYIMQQLLRQLADQRVHLLITVVIMPGRVWLLYEDDTLVP